MSDTITEILILLMLAMGNGFFAMAEIAVVSARGSRLEERASKGEQGAKAALKTTQNLNNFLSTIQIGITLIGIFAGAFGGTTIARKIEAAVETIPYLAPYGHVIGVATVVVGTTYLTLVLGELVPKRIALAASEDIAVRVAKPMQLLSRLAHPAVSFLGSSTDAVMKLLPLGMAEEPPVTEEEIRILMERGSKAGIIKKMEQDIVDRTLRLDDFKVAAIMTPDTKIKWLDLEEDEEIILHKAIEGGRTRYLVCRKHLDNVVGAVRVRDLFSKVLTGEKGSAIDLESIIFEPVFVVDSMPVLHVLELFKKRRTHIGVVLDEYGAVEGLVTMHDILEAMVGDVSAYKEDEEPFAIQREDGTWLLDGMMPVEDMAKMLSIPELPLEEEGDYHRLAGFVVTRLGKIPISSDSFEWHGFHFEVVDMDRNRVDKVLVSPLEKNEQIEENPDKES
ncbi:MAG: hemolysin family protein [Chloroflexota bacterium]